ncbi:hypothetical protein L2Y90_19880 [Burkholderia pyrrocinia]|uniref:hypothetical protein n=1 Tax=Burkholderia pyrrocinia TaxID=60550 RepID=UPI00215B46DD|nr:hypothetical protein [Burkholderia pyrrocinia]UVE69022.1 hypothetical protein L2Y90_19880 [Burkholderia pyrrocinia]
MGEPDRVLRRFAHAAGTFEGKDVRERGALRLGHAQAAGRVDVDVRTCGWNDKNAARVHRRALLRREGGKAAGDGLTTAGALPERPRETPLTITVGGVFHFRLNRC